ncbi:hypothetical protein ACU5DF_09870 [Aliivibrio wodanis]|uniref:hypothetical protein n=1 Tax=Aliivibrio wodanis TaxID=80852 RepID=UPI00406C24F4
MDIINQKEKITTLIDETIGLVVVSTDPNVINPIYNNLLYVNERIFSIIEKDSKPNILYNLISESIYRFNIIKSEVNTINKLSHTSYSSGMKIINPSYINDNDNDAINKLSIIDIKKFESNLIKISSLLDDMSNDVLPMVILDLTNNINTLKDLQSETNKMISDQSSEFNTNISNYKKDFEHYSKLNFDSHEKIINELIKTANDSELSLGRKVPELTELIKKELESTVIEKSNEIELLRKTVEADEIAFRSLFEEMKKLYKIAGDGKLSDQNIKQADEEKTAADKMRFFGVGLLFVLIGFAAWFLVLLTELPANTSYLSWFLPRFLTLTFCSMPAIYLLKESASHRHKENLYRQRGTQLATLGSYLADFNNDDKKMDIKSELIKNFYSFNDGKADTSNVPDFLKQMKEFAAVTKTFNKMVPAEQPQHQQTQSTPVTPIHEASNADEKKKAG